MRNCDELELSETARSQLDEFIDNVYEMIRMADSMVTDESENEQCKLL